MAKINSLKYKINAAGLTQCIIALHIQKVRIGELVANTAPGVIHLLRLNDVLGLGHKLILMPKVTEYLILDFEDNLLATALHTEPARTLPIFIRAYVFYAAHFVALLTVVLDYVLEEV